LANTSDPRKMGAIAFAVVAVLVAIGVIYWTVQSQQVQIVKTVDAGTGTNPKVLYMKAHKGDAAGGTDATAKDPNSLGDKP
jgi:hypothetical protein